MEPEWLSEARSVFDRISRAQEEAAGGFSPDLSGVGDRPENDTALLGPEQIRLDRDRFEHLLAEISSVLQDWLGEGPIVEGLESRLSDADMGSLLAAAIKGGGALEKRAGEIALRPEAFACAVRYAFAPFLRAYARELCEKLGDGFDPESHLEGRCPVCGAEAFMAEFDGEDGRRRLACGLCGTRWCFPRLECPFCRNRNHEKLGFLEVEGPRDSTAGYRVDVCEACGRYIKTLDRRTLVKTVALELANVLTPELDEAALGEGYGLQAANGRDNDHHGDTETQRTTRRTTEQ